MTLREAQWQFLKDVGKLISFIEEQGWSASGGELQRTELQQKEYLRTGKTKTIHSQHLLKLAIDLAIFDPQGNWIQDKSKLQAFGAFWEGLDPDNEWGGNWRSFIDTPHFERRLPS